MRRLSIAWLAGCQCALATLLPHPAFASAASKSGLDAPIIVTQAPRQKSTAPAGWDSSGMARGDWFEAARLVIVQSGRQTRVLSEAFQSACDANVSFDGKRVLFAGKKDGASCWRIWEIGVDGQGLRAVSPDDMDARSPIHVSTLFTLDSQEPWFTTVFVGRGRTPDKAANPPASSLYNIKLDGTELRRLTFSPNNSLDPFQMWDGRVIYAAERYPVEPDPRGPRVGIHSIHVEGADMELFCGGQGGRIQHMPCATGHGLVVFVEAQAGRWDGAGQLACVDESRPHRTYRRLTQDAAWLYRYPSAWRENKLLVGRSAAKGSGTWGIFCFDADTRQCEPVLDSPEYDDVQAAPIVSRRQPDGHSTVVNPKFDYGTFYGLNCYTADPAVEPHLKQGEVKRVRLIEGVLQQPDDASRTGQFPGPYVARRMIGEAPVEADGSFNVEVPADTPLLLQTLDERGLALGNCGWIWVKHKETRGCIGCHEDPELTPENEYVLALRRPSNRLVLLPGQRRSVAFREQVAPILQKHCVSAGCHGGERRPLRLPLGGGNPSERDLQQAFANLTAPIEGKAKGPIPQPGRYVDAGRARTSWLVWQLMGADTSRPWDQVVKQAGASLPRVSQMPPPGRGAPLTEDELRTLVQWIDLGAQFQAVKTTGSSPAPQQAPAP